MKMATSRPTPCGQLPGTKRCGKLWNSRSVSRKTTGSPVALSSLSMNDGFEAIVSKRKASDPSGACGPKASLGSSVALQQTPTRAHERSSRSALSRYFGEKSDTPVKWLSLDLQMSLIST